MYQVIKGRRTIHKYTTEKVKQEWVNEALELSLWAPNHKCTNPWKYIQCSPSTREFIGDLGVELKCKGTSLNSTAQLQIKSKLTNPSHLIIVIQKLSEDPFTAKEDYATMACSLQNAALYLWEKGVGTKWSSGGLTRHEKVYKHLNVDPKKEEIVGFFWIGHPEKTPDPKPRPALEDVLSEG